MPVRLDLEALNTGTATSSATSSSTKKTLHALSLAVAKSKRVVVVTGAGISCSSGIPDFRSTDGLYALVKARYPDVVLKGRDLFSASLFREPESTRIFYSFIAELKTCIDAAYPAPTHHFIKMLDSKGKLLRSYTQNIDGFEERVHLSGPLSGKGKGRKINTKETKNIQLHGDIHRVRCVMCSADFSCEAAHLEAFRDGTPPDCPECTERCNARLARNARPLAIGTLRPSIVLYDEAHPLGEEIGMMSTRDMGRKPDMLVIMGTSLKVHGIKKLVKDFASAVHHSTTTTSKASNQSTLPSSSSPSKEPSVNLLTAKNPRLVVFVNRTPPPADLAGIVDYWVEGDTDTWVAKCEADWRKARPQDWQVQATLFDTKVDKSAPLVEESNTWHVVKESATINPSAIGKPRHAPPFGRTGSENDLPSHLPPLPPSPVPIRVISKLPKSKLERPMKELPPIRRSTISKLPPFARAPPLSPQKRRPTNSQQTLVNDDADELSSDTEVLDLVSRNSKKRRDVDSSSSDNEPLQVGERTPERGLLFGVKKGVDDMSLDDIVPPNFDPAPPSQATAVSTRSSKAKTATGVAKSGNVLASGVVKKSHKSATSKPSTRSRRAKLDGGTIGNPIEL